MQVSTRYIGSCQIRPLDGQMRQKRRKISASTPSLCLDIYSHLYFIFFISVVKFCLGNIFIWNIKSMRQRVETGCCNKPEGSFNPILFLHFYNLICGLFVLIMLWCLPRDFFSFFFHEKNILVIKVKALRSPRKIILFLKSKSLISSIFMSHK